MRAAGAQCPNQDVAVPSNLSCLLGQVQGTVWSSPQLRKLQAEVDYEALEDDFAAKVTVKVGADGSGRQGSIPHY